MPRPARETIRANRRRCRFAIVERRNGETDDEQEAAPGLRLKGQDLTAALDQEARALPSLTPPAELGAGRTREARSMSFPTYVWQWLRQQSKLHDEPQNVIVLKALKAAGCPIPDHHLIDGRLKKPR